MWAYLLRAGWLLALGRPSNVGVHHNECSNGGSNKWSRHLSFHLGQTEDKFALCDPMRELNVCWRSLELQAVFLSLIHVKVKVLVTQSCPTLSNPMDSNPPGFSVHRIFQARILEWLAIPFSRESSQPRDGTWLSCIASRFFTVWATRGFIHVYTPVIGCFMHSVFPKIDVNIISILGGKCYFLGTMSSSTKLVKPTLYASVFNSKEKGNLQGIRKTSEAFQEPISQHFELAFCGTAHRAWMWVEAGWNKEFLFLIATYIFTLVIGGKNFKLTGCLLFSILIFGDDTASWSDWIFWEWHLKIEENLEVDLMFLFIFESVLHRNLIEIMFLRFQILLAKICLF